MSYQILKNSFAFHLLIILSLLSQFTFAQDNNEYSLLWKIEGNNLDSPSYLFGTMHIDDARVFNFSDAVMPAIENAEYFALEVNADSLVTAIINKEYDIPANDYYKKLLKPKDYIRLLKRFKEVNNFSLIDSEIMSPDQVVSLLIPDIDKDDDKSTFVDLYLLSQARTMNKKIVGLENVDYQINFFDNLSDEKKTKEVLSYLDIDVDSINRTKEIMTKVYATGDLNKIAAFVNQHDVIDDTMIYRNRVMSSSIISIMKKGSLFAGVGAAHLVGKDNVIELLENSGYRVSVVDAKFTGIADTYKIDPSKGPWYNYVDSDLGYALEIPKAPNLEEDLDNFKIYGYSDIATMANYFFLGLDLGYSPSEAQNKLIKDKMVDNIIKNREGEMLSEEKSSNSDNYSFDITSKLPDNIIMKSRFVIKNNHVYYFSVETSEAQINENYVNRFLNSIIIKGVEKKADDLGWRPFESQKGAFSIQIPAKPTDMSREHPNPLDPEGEPYFMNMYLATDVTQNNNYIFRYNDLPSGYFIQEPEIAFKATEESFTKKAKLLSEPKVIYLDSLEGREYELSISDKYHSIVRVYFRGNRTYLLLKQKLTETEKASSDDTFFNSFTLLPYLEQPLETFESSNGDFKIKLFANVKEEIDSSDYSESNVIDSNDFLAVNPNTGGIYQYSYSNVNKYFRITSQKKLLSDYKSGLLEYNDSIVKENYSVKGGDSIIEFSVKHKLRKNNKLQTFNRIWFNNDRVQIAKAIVNEEELNSGIVQRVFNSVKMKPVKSNLDVFESKAKYIIEDLKSKDSITYNLALKAFAYYEFTKEDLALLHKLLEYDFSDDRNEAIKSKLINEFTIINDENSLEILERFYNKSSTSDNLKVSILVAINSIVSDKSLQLYNKLLFSSPPTEKNSYVYNILQPFTDSLNYGLENYDKLIKLMPNVQYRRDLINLFTDLFNSDINAKAILKLNNDKILEYLKTDFDSFSNQTLAERDEDYTYNNLVYAYLNNLNIIKYSNEAGKTFTLNIINGDYEKWMKLQAIRASIFNNYSLDQEVLNTYAEDLYFRFEIMEALHKENRLSEINKDYIKTEEFAKLSFYNYAGEDNGYPDTIKITEVITKNKQDFFVVKFSYNSDESEESEVATNYIGIVGPIKKISQNTDFKMFDSLSYWEAYNDDWEQPADKIISDFLEFQD